MDCKLLFAIFLVIATVIISSEAGKHKKVVIHVPYKVKTIKHTHTIYKTIHHHDHDHGHKQKHKHSHSKSSHGHEEHEHFHHHGNLHGHQSVLQPVVALPKHPLHSYSPY